MAIALVNSINTNQYMDILSVSILVPLFLSSLQAITNSNLDKRDYDVSQEFFKSWLDHFEKSGQEDLYHIEEIRIDTIPESITSGDVVWVKGASGSGKSQLVKRLLRFRDEGLIKLNNRDIKEYRLNDIRDRIEYISQNIPIIKGSLRDNLFLDIPYSKETEEQMQADPILQSIINNKTMDSMITEGATNISGGEKQKIAVMRTLYKDVDVLIIDEITSGIDDKTALEIYERIFEKMDGKITFVISHNDLHKKYVNKIIDLGNELSCEKLQEVSA